MKGDVVKLDPFPRQMAQHVEGTICAHFWKHQISTNARYFGRRDVKKLPTVGFVVPGPVSIGLLISFVVFRGRVFSSYQLRD